jgi:hypothetical protein
MCCQAVGSSDHPKPISRRGCEMLHIEKLG